MNVDCERMRLRKAALSRRDAIAPAVRRGASLKIVERLRALPIFQAAAGAAFFRAQSGEPDLDALAREFAASGHTVYLPTWDRQRGVYRFAVWPAAEDWAPGPMGIPQPAVPEWTVPRKSDVVIVPGVAFDADGNRLGHGEGHYDRMLERLPALRIGVAFEVQMIDRIPAREGDALMDWVVTEDRAMRIRSGFSENQKENPS